MAIVVNVGGERPPYYDRNPASRILFFDAGGEAPDPLEIRSTYTVPIGSKAMLEVISLDVFRASAASVAGRVIWQVLYTATTGGSGAILSTVLTAQQNSIGDRMSLSVSGLWVFLPGDTVALRSQDLSTGGTISFNGAAKLIEFDA